MKTDALIAALAADARPRPPVRAMLLPGLLVALLAVLVAVWAILGFRDDLGSALGEPFSAMRFVLTGALAVIAVRLALVLARPEGRGLARLWPLAALAALAAGLLVWAFVATPPDARATALVGKTMVSCLVTIPLLSVLPVAAFLVALRRGATTAPALAGCVAGLGGGGLAAMAYATHCIEDSPLFYVTWYGLAIAIVALGATLVGARLLRW